MENEDNETIEQQSATNSSGYLPWIFGVLFLLGGIGSLGKSFLGGLAVAIAGAVLLPPVKEFIDSKIKDKNASLGFRVILIVAMFGLGVNLTQKAELAEFTANRPQIIASLEQKLTNRDYQGVVSQGEKYAEFKDSQIESMITQAKAKLDAIERERVRQAAEAERQAKLARFKANRQQIIASLEQQLANEDYQGVASQGQQYAEFDPEIKSMVAQARIRLAASARQRREAADAIANFSLSDSTMAIIYSPFGITVENKSDFEWTNFVLYLNPQNEGIAQELIFAVNPKGFRAPAEKDKVYTSLASHDSITVPYSDFVHTHTKEFFSTDRYKIVRVHITCTVSLNGVEKQESGTVGFE